MPSTKNIYNLSALRKELELKFNPTEAYLLELEIKKVLAVLQTVHVRQLPSHVFPRGTEISELCLQHFRSQGIILTRVESMFSQYDIELEEPVLAHKRDASPERHPASPESRSPVATNPE